MRRLPSSPLLLALFLALLLPACTALGGPDPIPVSTVGVRVGEATSAAELATALDRAGAEVALVAAPQDDAWFRQVAQAANLHLSGPGDADGLGLAFLGPEALGDTTITLDYEGGSFVLHDALYELPDERYLDLLAFRVDEPDQADPVITALTRYIATDVMPASAVVVAVAVPDAETADAVARMLSPAYYDIALCDDGDPGPVTGGLRLFQGPEARMRCRDARFTGGPGDWIHASLEIGRP